LQRTALSFQAEPWLSKRVVVAKGDIAGALHEPQHYAANVVVLIGACCWVVYTFSAQIVGACMTGMALIFNNVYLRRHARRCILSR